MTLLRADKEKSLLQRRDTKPQVDLIRIILVTCWMSCLGDRALAKKKSIHPLQTAWTNCLVFTRTSKLRRPPSKDTWPLPSKPVPLLGHFQRKNRWFSMCMRPGSCLDTGNDFITKPFTHICHTSWQKCMFCLNTFYARHIPRSHLLIVLSRQIQQAT